MKRSQSLPSWALLIFAFLIGFFKPLKADNPKYAFWQEQRKGANGDGGALKGAGTTPEEWLRAASNAGIEFVRLNVVDWESQERDFLVGDADAYTGIPENDLAALISVLDIANRYNVKIVLTMFSLPGARNRQKK